VVDPTGTVPPTAAASASPATGDAPLIVQFSSAGSADPDGTIASYAWNFGDGSSSAEANPLHTYASVGVYTATLTITDNSGFTGSSSVTITALAPNAVPSASFTATPNSGTAPITVSFNASASADSDGTIASYAWNFGDGTTGSGVTTQHTYTAAGTYTATLKVTDDRGATSSTSVTVQVQAAPVQTIRVESIVLTSVKTAGGTYGQAVVRITNLGGAAIAGASVTVTWSGIVTGTSIATTDSNGYATLVSKKSKKSGTITCKVTNVTAPGCVYSAANNIVTSASKAL